MRHSTPFFAAFGPLLFGKARRSQIQALCQQNSPSPSLSQFQSAFGDLVPKALLALNVSKLNSRRRIFCPLVTFWAFLAQVLERGSSCRDALRRIIAWFEFEFPCAPPPSPETPAYCRARARLEDATLEKIGSHLATQMQRNAPEAQLWQGRRVKILDGTTVSMPDTSANQARWPQSRSQKPGCGFPLLKLVGLFCLASGALLESVHTHLRRHEAVLARLHHFADAIHARHGKPRKQSHLLAQLLLTIALDLLPLRPNRSEPRAKKRRPKNYQLLTRPRRKMGNLPHRNRPGKKHPKVPLS